MLDYGKYITVAKRYQYKAKYQDREDLNHDIIIALAEAQRAKDNNGGGRLSDIAMLRIASYECQKYWRQIRRQYNILSLNTELNNGDGDSIELIETIADDKAIDLDAWMDASIWLLGCPRRLVQIAKKITSGNNLTPTDSQYLWRYRKREQKSLVTV
ncbi:hypothetical protein ACFLUX_03175 [Chloroflexota bacterium]